MLCQKCGLQEARVHLETLVFRQKIEEHLCRLCAGERAPADAAAPLNLSKRERDSSPVPKTLDESIRELIRRSKEQGHVTVGEIDIALAETGDDRGAIDYVLSILIGFKIEILESVEIQDHEKRLEELRTSRNAAIDDPLQMYLEQIGQVPSLTDAEEIAVAKRIERAERKALKTYFQIPAVSSYLTRLGAQLLLGEESVARIVSTRQIESPQNYFKDLPKLVGAVQKQEALVLEAWKDSIESRTAAVRKRTLAKIRRREAALRSHFAAFSFKLRVYEEYLELQQPLFEEIRLLIFQIDHGKPSKTPSELKVVRARLRAIEMEQRIAPLQLLKIVRQTTVDTKEVHHAKIELMQHHLQRVIWIARKSAPGGTSFLDLIQAGNVGLMRAIEKFDYRKGYKFSIYASCWIHQAVRRVALDL